jgi:DNA (cytosine-5)-methyltransferase 1
LELGYLNTIDLFSGPGGLSIGLKLAGYRIVANVEINRDAMETYTSHDTQAHHYNLDVREVSFTKYKGEADIVVGGPPCQPFSIGGLRKAQADERDMIPEFIRCLKECRPEAFILENVPGLTQKRTRPYFDYALSRLSNCGFQLNWAVLNSADYGIPQKRKRLFVLGARNIRLRFPVATHGLGTENPYLSPANVIGNEPIGEAPNCPVKFARYPDLRPSPYAGHVYNGGGRPIDPEGPCHTILASAGGYKTHWFDTLNIAPEYHAHLKAGGRPRDGEVPGARRMSVEESALVQTFSPAIQFAGRKSSQYRQVGDAVPPDLAFVVGKSVFSQLNGSANSLALLTPSMNQFALQSELAL